MGEYVAARDACQFLDAMDAMDQEDRLPCARVNATLGSMDVAVDILRDSVRLSGSDRTARLQALEAAARILEERVRHDAAADFLLEASELAPEDPEILLRVVRNLLEAGRGDNAAAVVESRFEVAAAANPSLGRRLLGLFDAYGESGKALNLSAGIVSRGLVDADELDAIVSNALRSGNPATADDAARRWLQAQAMPRIEAALAAAAIMERHGAVAAAARLLEEELAVPEAGDTGDDPWLRLGRLHVQSGNPDSAESAFSRFLGREALSAERLLRVSEAWSDAGKPDRVVSLLKGALDRFDPLPIDVLLRLGKALHDSGDDSGEMAAYRQGAKRVPNASVLWTRVGEAKVARGEPAAAEDALGLALADASADLRTQSRAHAALAEAILARDRTRQDEIEAHLLAALDTGAEDATVVARVERVASRLPDSRAVTLAVLRRAVKREPGKPGLWERLAAAAARSGLRAEALDAWIRFIETSENPPAAMQEGVGSLVQSRFLNEALMLSRHAVVNGMPVPPAIARTLGESALDLSDHRAARRHLRTFLDGPVVLDHDYLAMSERLSASGLDDLAGRSLDMARKVGPGERIPDIELSSGRRLLRIGKADEAAKHFNAAASSGRDDIVLAVARAYRDHGLLGAAEPWFRKAVLSATGDFAPSLSEHLAVLTRTGRSGEIATLADALASRDWRSWQELHYAAATVAETGESSRALRLLELGGRALGASDEPAIQQLQASLLLRLSRPDGALRTLLDACSAPHENADTACAGLADRFSAADRDADAVQGLRRRADSGNAGHRTWMVLSQMLLDADDVDGAFEAAMSAAQGAESLDEFLGRIIAPLRMRGRQVEALRLTEVLAASAETLSKARVNLEQGRILLEMNRPEDAVLAFWEMVSSDVASAGRAWRELAGSGRTAEADSFMNAQARDAIASLPVEDLGAILGDLLYRERFDSFRNLVERYLEANDGIAPAREVLGRILSALGLPAMALEHLEKVPGNRLGAEGRLALIQSLWRLGRRDDAIREARFPETSRDPETEKAVLATAAFLAGEEALGEAIRLLSSTDGSRTGSPEQGLGQARLLSRSGLPDGLTRGRELFLAILDILQTPGTDSYDYVRIEARAGTLDALIDEMEPRQGLVVDELRLAAACLTGRKDAIRDARRRLLGDGGDTMPTRLAAASRAMFACGNWESAAESAEQALDRMAPGQRTEDLVQIAVISARMAGRRGVERIQTVATRGLEDALTAIDFRTVVAQASGELARVATLKIEKARRLPVDAAGLLDTVEAALRSGSESIRKDAQSLLLEGLPEHRAPIRNRLREIYTSALRPELVPEVIPGGDSQSPLSIMDCWTLFHAALDAGDPRASIRAGECYLSRTTRGPGAISTLVGTAAIFMAPTVVEHFMGEVPQALIDSRWSTALTHVAVMHTRLGRIPEASATLALAEAAAVSTGVFEAEIARLAMVEPGFNHVPSSPSIARLDLASCLAGAQGAADVSECPRKTPNEPRGRLASWFMAGAGRAMAEGRHEAAEAMFREAFRHEPLRATGWQTATRVLDYLGDWEDWNEVPRTSLGKLGLELTATARGLPDPGGFSLRAHLSAMTGDSKSALEDYDFELAIDPSNGNTRNGLAYLLSMVPGLDLNRSIIEARTAQILRPMERAYSMETEAWALFRAGRHAEALDTQMGARRLWTRELGTGLAESHYHLGRILEAMGRVEEARDAYRKAFLLDQGRWSSRKALERWRALGGR
jgi:tetratricopeptide (TPR) repeat protein